MGGMRRPFGTRIASHINRERRAQNTNSGRIINFVCADRVLLNNLFSIGAGRERRSISRINYTFLSSTSANKQFLSAVRCVGREHFGASQAPKLMTIDESAAVRFLFYYWKRKANLMARAHICIFFQPRALTIALACCLFVQPSLKKRPPMLL